MLLSTENLWDMHDFKFLIIENVIVELDLIP